MSVSRHAVLAVLVVLISAASSGVAPAGVHRRDVTAIRDISAFSWLPKYYSGLGDALVKAVMVGRKTTDVQVECLATPLCCNDESPWLEPNPEGSATLREDISKLIPTISIKGEKWHPGPLTLNAFDDVLAHGSVMMVGDSTMRMDFYELWACLSTHEHEPLDEFLLAAKQYVWGKFNRNSLTSGAGHKTLASRLVTIAGGKRRRIGYYGYYWAAEDLAAFWDSVFARVASDRYRTIVYNIGLHLLWQTDFVGWQNATSLANYEEHLAAVATRAIRENVTLVFVTTNPICAERMVKGPKGKPELTEAARSRSPEYVALIRQRIDKMTPETKENFESKLTWDQIMLLNLHSESGPIELNRRMASVVNREPFLGSPYIGFYDRHAVLEQAKCFFTPDGDGRHYVEASLCTSAGLLNLLQRMYAVQGTLGLHDSRSEDGQAGGFMESTS